MDTTNKTVVVKSGMVELTTLDNEKVIVSQEGRNEEEGETETAEQSNRERENEQLPMLQLPEWWQAGKHAEGNPFLMV